MDSITMQNAWRVQESYRTGGFTNTSMVRGIGESMVESDSPPYDLEPIMERAGSLIGKLKLSPEVADPETRARAAWALAAGKKIARHTLAAALVRGTLVVEVEDMVWQKQLNTLRHFLLRNLKEALGGDVVTEIDFRPMPRRRTPQRAESARRVDSSGIQDPVMAMLYRQSKRRGTA